MPKANSRTTPELMHHSKGSESSLKLQFDNILCDRCLAPLPCAFENLQQSPCWQMW